MQFQNKAVLVTGASSGIGRATATAFATQGAGVALVARRAAELERFASELRGQGHRAVAIRTDITNDEACAAAVSQAVSQFGKLDVLVNAAGIIGTGSIETTTREAWHRMMQINVDGVFYMMQAAVPHLATTCGTIINVSSVTGLRAFPNILAYCVSKAALDQLTRCAALELAPKGIRVNAVNPGVVVTNLHRSSGMDEERYAAFLEHSKTTHPMGRVGSPEEIAEAILFLASERAGWITGATLSIDGGRHLTCAR